MKEIVNEILKEEEAARKIIEKTKLEAEDIIAAAKNEAKNYLEKEKADIKRVLVQKQEIAEKFFYTEKQKILKETEEESVRLRESKEKDIPAIAKAYFSQVISKPR